jgi:hypothetical protein
MTNVETTRIGNGRGRRARTLVPEDETRHDKFVRLALARMSALKAKARQVKNLAIYPHTETQANKIVGELKALAADIEAAFAPRGSDRFSF